mmetsp:Transcript_8018/g.22928  ORF Transcript_8018/g.22928 Transcript_8018/m.22928 type:complete len:297 (+) Transcript_8018:2941-3831(+)
MAVACDLHVLVPVQAQAHWSLQIVRRDSSSAIDEYRPRFLATKPATKPLRFANDLVLWDTQHMGDRPLVLCRCLGRGVRKNLVALLWNDIAGVRLQVKVVLCANLHVSFNDVRASLTRKARVHVASLHPRLPVCWIEAILFDSFLDGHDVRQVLVGHLHRPRSIPGFLLCFCHHDTNDLANTRDFLGSKAFFVRYDRTNVIPTWHLLVAIVTHHARHTQGFLGVNVLQESMGFGGQHERGVQTVFAQWNIVHILRLAGNLQFCRGVRDGLANNVLTLLVIVKLQSVASWPRVQVRR